MSIFELKDVKTTPDIFHVYSKSINDSSIPLVIDNGECFVFRLYLLSAFEIEIAASTLLQYFEKVLEEYPYKRSTYFCHSIQDLYFKSLYQSHLMKPALV